jgi:hypothetical protein
MAEPEELDATYHFCLETLVARGQAPHFTEIADHFGETAEQGRARLHDLMATGMPMWLHPDTDLIASLAPFNNLPNQYRITVDGEQKWFAQCGLETVTISFVFPGRSVRIDAPCLDCGEPLWFVMKDGVITDRNSDEIRFFVDVPLRKWYENIPFA